MKSAFLSTFINIRNEEEYEKAILSTLDSNVGTKTFFYLNSHSFHTVETNPEFAAAFNSADFIIPDGYSIVLATKLLNGQKLKKVVFTYFFLERLAQRLAERKSKVYFLGTTSENLKRAISTIEKSFPEIQIAGFRNGFFNDSESGEIIEQINSSEADILIAGMGIPKSEIWLAEHKNELAVKCAISVGGFYEYVAGHLKLAPGWIYNSGTEWLYRLVQEPKRLWRRYLSANSYFIFRIAKAYFNHESK